MTTCTYCKQTIHTVGKDMWLHEDGAAYCKNTTATPANPNEPTLTCSEVVDRLAAEIARDIVQDNWPTITMTDAEAEKHIAGRIRDLATPCLHSWRERRVQELEEALAQHPLTPEPQSTQPDTGSEKK